MGKGKVLHIFPRYKIGGAPINILRFFKGSVDLFDNYSVGNKEDEYLFENFKKNAIKAYNVDTSIMSLHSILSVFKIYIQVAPDIVHVNGKGGAFFGLLLKLIYRKRITLIYTFRGFHLKYTGIKSTLHKKFENILAKLMDVGIAVSDSERDFYLSQVKVNECKVIVIPNGIEVEKRDLDREKEGLLNKFKYNIVTLSRINHQKDLLTMLKSFEKLHRSDIGLHILGGYINDEYEREFKFKLDSFYEEMKFKDNVFFWGDVNNGGDLLHYFDIYWSTALFEGLPTAIIEAMMSRVLVVGTDCRGNIDLVKNDVTGILTNMKDVNSNTQGIEKALNLIESNISNKLLDKASKLSKDFAVNNNIDKISRLYNSFMKKK